MVVYILNFILEWFINPHLFNLFYVMGKRAGVRGRMERQDAYLFIGLLEGILAGGIAGSILNNWIIIGLGFLVSCACFLILGVKSISRMELVHTTSPSHIPFTLSPNDDRMDIASKSLLRFKEKN